MTIDEVTIRRAAEVMHHIDCGCQDIERHEEGTFDRYIDLVRAVAPVFRDEYRMLVHDQDALEVAAWRSGFAAGKHEGMHSGDADQPLGRCDFTREEGAEGDWP